MKKFHLLIFFLVSSMVTSAQVSEHKILYNNLASASDPKERFEATSQLCRYFHYAGINDSLRNSANQLLELAQTIKSDSLLAEAYNWIGNYFDNTGNYALSLQFYFKALNLSEKSGNVDAIARSNGNIGWSYIHLGDFHRGTIFCKRAISRLLSQPTNAAQLVAPYDNLAIAYLGLGQADSALRYTQLAHAENLKVKNTFEQSYILYQFARTYQLLQEYDLAESFFRKAINYSREHHNLQPLSMAATYYCNMLIGQRRYAEAQVVGWQGIRAAYAGGYKRQLIDNAEVLQGLYDKTNRLDSAYAYAKLVTAYRDSVFNEQKSLMVQNVIFSQQLYEKEAAQAKVEALLERKHNLQYAAIALGVVTLFISFLLFSHTVIANQKLIKFLGVLSLIIVFEFINLLIHPSLAEFTHHSPFLMLIVMVCIAALLIPLHHRLEHWITHRLVEKNNRIRLAAAKRIIRKLERPDLSMNN